MINGLLALFTGSLLASTIVPGGVEVLLYYMFHSGEHDPIVLLAVATLGNTLGGIITFAMGGLLGRGLHHFSWHRRIERWFALNESALSRVRRFGVPVLFFSWMPVIGDPLCIAGGYLRLAMWPSFAMIFLGKLVRYAVLLWVFAQPWAEIPG